MMKRIVLFAAGVCAAIPAAAQSEVALREYFEGRSVIVKMEMPANKIGVDIFPDAVPSINYAEYGKRLKRFGVSLKRNEAVTVTMVKVKPKNIEFQLGGGGYGTVGDDTSTSVYVPTADKTQREKNLERDVKRETDAVKKRDMQEELDDLRKRRSRENARLQAAVSQAEAMKEESRRQRAALAGSRFNLVFPSGVPAHALHPEFVKTALQSYVEFDDSRPRAAAEETQAPGGLRKGMSAAELRSLYGEPTKRDTSVLGDLRIEILTFKKDGSTLEATLVEGVLVRFKQWSD